MAIAMSDASAPTNVLARLRAGQLQGSTRLDLRGGGLSELPPEVLALSDTLEVLDVSNNALVGLPDGVARLKKLHTFFASNNRFTELPPVLGRLPALDTLGFKANRIETVPAQALAPTLRWLILTDNRIAVLPPTLTDCDRMQKLMLAGNRLARLPAGMGRLQRLELLRLSANQFARADQALPDDLLDLPRLAWLAHAGNPLSAAREQAAQAVAAGPSIPWTELRLQALLGEGASGEIPAATWQPAHGPAREVAVKLFKGTITSDGLPQSEIAATLVAGKHPNLVGAIGVLAGHPLGRQGLVMPRLAADWAPLAAPPSMASCSRDVYDEGLRLPAATAAAVARAAAAALAHLHAQGLTHGDLYAHNLLIDGNAEALLSDFGAASFLPSDGFPSVRFVIRVKWLTIALRSLESEIRRIESEDRLAAATVPGRIQASVSLLGGQPGLGRPGRVVGTRELLAPRTRFIVPYRATSEGIEIRDVFHRSRRPPEQARP